MSHFVLKTAGPVSSARAIMSAIPAAHGPHAHARSRRQHQGDAASSCAQFATMGSIVARDVYGSRKPRVGLLNIGEEDMKGHEIVQAAHALIGASGAQLHRLRRRR